MRRVPALCIAAALPLACAACQDYVARRDTLTLGSGDAVQANMAKHTIDPWPPRANQVDYDTDGERLAHAIERYRNPSNGQGIAILPPVPIGPPNVPSINAPGLR